MPRGTGVPPVGLSDCSKPDLRPSPQSSSAPIAIVPTIDHGARYDAVLVDAPCTGSGTWRRAPHLKWTITPAQIEQAGRQQLTLLTQFAAHVRPDGQLVYATCSLSRRENQDVVAAFLAAHPAFQLEPPVNPFGFAAGPDGTTLLPARHKTDGFFVALLRRSLTADLANLR